MDDKAMSENDDAVASFLSGDMSGVGDSNNNSSSRSRNNTTGI